jgi:integrase
MKYIIVIILGKALMNVTLCHFGAFVVNEGVTELDQIKPPHIKRFIAAERAREITSGNAIGHLSTFFSGLEGDEVIERSPVIRGRHSRNWVRRTRLPYFDNEMSVLEKKIEESGNLLLMLAFVIGEGCGPRISEVCNIRLPFITQASDKLPHDSAGGGKVVYATGS